MSADYSDAKIVLGVDVAAGQFIIHDQMTGFSFDAAVADEELTMVVKASKVRAAKKAENWIVGNVIYFDETLRLCSNQASAGRAIGMCSEESGPGESAGVIIFDGFLNFAKA